MTRSSSHLGRLLLEMVSIVFAVVLGFAVTNWDAARRDRTQAARALDRIALELDANLTGLARAGPYYATMAERLDSLVRARGDGPALEIDIPGWRGLSPPSIRTASFRVATQTGALENIPFDLADELAVTYDMFEDFRGAVDHALGAVLTGELTEVSSWRAVFALCAELAVTAQRQAKHALEVLRSGRGT